MNPWLS